jgi:hypothetical protein
LDVLQDVPQVALVVQHLALIVVQIVLIVQHVLLVLIVHQAVLLGAPLVVRFIRG